jgi:hypothetical protein
MKKNNIYTTSIIFIIMLLIILSGCNEVVDEYFVEGAEGLEGYVKTPGFSKDVFVSGKYAYVVDGKWGVQVIDIDDKSKPMIAGNLKTNWAWDFYFYNTYGLVADYAEGFVISDLTNPEEPEVILREDILVGASSLFIQDTIVYITDHSGKLLILDITEIQNPVRLSVIEDLGWVYDIYVSDGFGYILSRSVENDESGLKIFDLNDTKKPELLSSIKVEGTPNEVVVHEDHAYIASSRYGVISIDISDKVNPYEAFVLDTGDEATDIIIDGSYAYITDRLKGIIKASIEDSGKLSPVKTWELSGYSDGVFVSDGFIFVANYDGLIIFADE